MPNSPYDDLKDLKKHFEDGLRAIQKFGQDTTDKVIGPAATKSLEASKAAFNKAQDKITEILGRNQEAEVSHPNVADSPLPTDEGEL